MPGIIDEAALANGLDPDLLHRIARIESGGNPRAVTGSYKGLFQLSPSEFQQYGGGDIFNALDNANAAARKIAAEAAWFQDQYGRPPTPTDIYMVHQQGQAGYGAHLSNPDQPAWQSMLSTGEGKQKGERWAKAAIWGNVPDQLKSQFGNVDNITSQQFVDLWRNKVEGNPGPPVQLAAGGEAAPLGGAPQQQASPVSIASMLGLQPRTPQPQQAQPQQAVPQQAYAPSPGLSSEDIAALSQVPQAQPIQFMPLSRMARFNTLQPFLRGRA